ncbi:hypothetical protein DFJ73DRAFT_813822, partial [Zopfochytrium polystomum]
MLSGVELPHATDAEPASIMKDGREGWKPPMAVTHAEPAHLMLRELNALDCAIAVLSPITVLSKAIPYPPSLEALRLLAEETDQALSQAMRIGEQFGIVEPSPINPWRQLLTGILKGHLREAHVFAALRALRIDGKTVFPSVVSPATAAWSQTQSGSPREEYHARWASQPVDMIGDINSDPDGPVADLAGPPPTLSPPSPSFENAKLPSTAGGGLSGRVSSEGLHQNGHWAHDEQMNLPRQSMLGDAALCSWKRSSPALHQAYIRNEVNNSAGECEWLDEAVPGAHSSSFRTPHGAHQPPEKISKKTDRSRRRLLPHLGISGFEAELWWGETGNRCEREYRPHGSPPRSQSPPQDPRSEKGEPQKSFGGAPHGGFSGFQNLGQSIVHKR